MGIGEWPDAVARVMDAAAEHGLQIEPVEHPEGVRTAAEAAAAVGCDLGQIVKSLVFAVDDQLVLALTSGANRVDASALAALAGGTRCGRADVQAVRKSTGYAIGGVPPFGHADPINSFLDPALLGYDVVWAAAGTPRHLFAIDSALLNTLTGAIIGSFTE